MTTVVEPILSSAAPEPIPAAPESTVPAPEPPLPLSRAVKDAALIPLTVPQYQQMIETGILPEDSTVELLRGVLVRTDRSSPGRDPMGHSPLHKLIVARLISLAARVTDSRRHIQIHLPIACPPDAAPDPDASIIRGTPDDYVTRLAGKGDVFCVIEVAHSSLARDREAKLPIYAGAGIPQYLIINLANNTVEIFEDPDPAAELYRTKTTANRGQKIRLRVGETETFELDAAEVLP